MGNPPKRYDPLVEEVKDTVIEVGGIEYIPIDMAAKITDTIIQTEDDIDLARHRAIIFLIGCISGGTICAVIWLIACLV